MDRNGIFIFFSGLILVGVASIAAVHNFVSEDSLFSYAAAPSLHHAAPSPTPPPGSTTTPIPTPSVTQEPVTLIGTINNINEDASDQQAISITIDTTTIYITSQTQINDQQGNPTTLSQGESVTVIGIPTDGGMNASNVTVNTTPTTTP